MIIDTNPEFGLELTLVIPYAYWLHQRGELEKVITSKGMKPFYYFCDNVEEKHEYRTIDNKAAGLNSIPNNWIRHNAIGVFGKDYSELNDKEKTNINGVLDYTKWVPPLYNKEFNENLNLKKRSILVSNRYNIEHGHPPIGFFDIECLYNIFNYLTEKGYNVIYKRPKNTEFPLDQNEINTLHNQETLTANVDGVGLINDYELVNYYDNVYLLDDIVSKHPDFTYNEVQLNLFNNAKGFITMGGGSTLFPCFFKKPTVAYYGGTLTEIRRKCFWEDSKGNKNIKNYHYMINPNLIPFIDKDSIDMNNNYKEFLNTIKQTF